MMHYHEGNQYADTISSDRCTKLITDQNIFVTNGSAKSIRYFQKDLHPLTTIIPTSKSRISKRHIRLMFGLMSTVVSAINAVQINTFQKQKGITSDKIATLTHISEIQDDHLNHFKIEN
jgi:hypothetical protein